jgi:hypothetical protein
MIKLAESGARSGDHAQLALPACIGLIFLCVPAAVGGHFAADYAGAYDHIPKAEAQLFDDLPGPWDVARVAKASEDAISVAKEAYRDPNGAFEDDDGTRYSERFADSHLDAYRHIYIAHRLAHDYGPEFAAKWSLAHERVPGNTGPAEAMDLYNDSIGLKIALEHPNASEQDVRQYIRQAIDGGQAIVINQQHQLAWSNDVPTGSTGTTCQANQPGCVRSANPDLTWQSLIGG